MKVGILIDRLNVGGVEKIALEEVAALRTLGIEACLVVLRRKGVVDNAFPELQKTVPIIFLDDRFPSLLKASFQFPIFHFFSLFHLTYPLIAPIFLKNKEFDYLIVHGTYTAFTAITIKNCRSVPFSAFIWDPISYIVSRVYAKSLSQLIRIPLLYMAQCLDKVILTNTDCILVGGSAHNSLLKKLHTTKPIVEIIPGTHPSNLISSNKKNYILAVTAWKKGKKPEYIFELLNLIPNLHFTLVGKWIDTNYKNEFIKKILRLQYSKQVTVVGEVSEKDLKLYYQEAQFLIQINDDRGFGLPALEAAANSTTFVIPEGQGVCKLFENNIDCYFVKEQNTTQIVSIIKKLIKNPNISIDMGRRAYKKVVEKYSWEQHAKQLMKVIQNNKKLNN